MTHFGKRIREARLALGVSQAGLCELFCSLSGKKTISRTAIAQWETGKIKEIEGDNLLRVSFVLGVSPEWIVYGKENRWVKEGSNESHI